MEQVVRVVGDVHGKIDEYVELVKDCRYSIQLGDMGFKYDKLDALSSADHCFIPGNHDNYQALPLHARYDYGMRETPFPYFYIRGERSIDKKYRIPYVSWYPEEEMGYYDMNLCLDFYKHKRPEIVFSHGCPASVIEPLFGRNSFDGAQLEPSNTANFLQACLDAHMPRVWYFGHYHATRGMKVGRTYFQCLAELDFVDLDFAGEEI